MSALRQHIVIDAPADNVWEVIAGRFDRIGEWAAAIPASAFTAADTDLDVGAPVAARVCECQVDIAAEFTTRGILGRLARTVILARVLRDGRHVLDDLKHYVETGIPSPRKLSRQRH